MLLLRAVCENCRSDIYAIWIAGNAGSKVSWRCQSRVADLPGRNQFKAARQTVSPSHCPPSSIPRKRPEPKENSKKELRNRFQTKVLYKGLGRNAKCAQSGRRVLSSVTAHRPDCSKQARQAGVGAVTNAGMGSTPGMPIKYSVIMLNILEQRGPGTVKEAVYKKRRKMQHREKRPETATRKKPGV